MWDERLSRGIGTKVWRSSPSACAPSTPSTPSAGEAGQAEAGGQQWKLQGAKHPIGIRSHRTCRILNSLAGSTTARSILATGSMCSPAKALLGVHWWRFARLNMAMPRSLPARRKEKERDRDQVIQAEEMFLDICPLSMQVEQRSRGALKLSATKIIPTDMGDMSDLIRVPFGLDTARSSPCGRARTTRM